MPGVERALPGCPPRLADRVAIGVLTRTYPPALVDRVLAECGRVERRHRLLPARLVVYYVLALALFAGWPTRRSCAAWSRAAGSVVVAQPREPWRTWRVPAKSALVQARARLGAAPCGCCSSRRQLRWPPTRPRVVGIAACGCWRWMGRVWMWPTLPPMRPRSVGRGPAAARGLGPSRRSGWSGWPSAAPTPSPRSRSAPVPPARPAWPHRC